MINALVKAMKENKMASKEYEAVLKVLLEAVQSVNGAGQQAPEGIP